MFGRLVGHWSYNSVLTCDCFVHVPTRVMIHPTTNEERVWLVQQMLLNWRRGALPSPTSP